MKVSAASALHALFMFSSSFSSRAVFVNIRMKTDVLTSLPPFFSEDSASLLGNGSLFFCCFFLLILIESFLSLFFFAVFVCLICSLKSTS